MQPRPRPNRAETPAATRRVVATRPKARRAVAVAVGALAFATITGLNAHGAGAHPALAAIDVTKLIDFNIWDWLAKLIRYIAIGDLMAAIGVVVNAQEPRVIDPFFHGEYFTMIQITLYLLVPMAIAATIGAILKGGMRAIAHIYFFGIPVAILGGFAALALINLCLTIEQDMTRAVMDPVIPQVQKFIDASNAYFDGAGDTTGANSPQFQSSLVQFFVMGTLLLMCLFLWVEMIFRQVMLYMGILFLPLALAAFMWGPIRVWFYNLAEIIVTMIFAKFVAAAILAFGFLTIFRVLNPSPQYAGSGNVGLLFSGTVVVFLATFALPVMLAFVLAPSHAILRGKEIYSMTPFNATRTYGRGVIQAGIRNTSTRIRGRGRAQAGDG